ncbi:MAG: MaoC family dehydratase [Acidimicrobiales bacterium]
MTAAGPAGTPAGPLFEEVAVGDALPELVIPLTRTLIVSTAIASRDYQDVHHDPVLAVERGSKDIFMNILSTNGLVGRYVTDWSGPSAVLSDVNIRLGAPNYPDDVMTLTGSVTAKDDRPGEDGMGTVELEVRGTNGLGDHVTGTVRLRLRSRTAGSRTAGGTEGGVAR